MPSHAHTVIDESALPNVRQLMRSYALWRNRRRGERGPLWRYDQQPTEVYDDKHASRAVRYVHLNACREHMTRDPLAWPFSTHRDALGLAWPAIVRPVPRPEDFHRWISSDPDVRVDGSALPAQALRTDVRAVSPKALRDAVSALTRLTLPKLTQRGPARALLARCLLLWTELPTSRIADIVGVHASTVRLLRSQSSPTPGEQERRVLQILGDPRFPALRTGPHPWRQLTRSATSSG